MSSKATMQNLLPGEEFEFTNTTGKAVELVLRTQWGTTLRTTVPIGGHIELTLGRESGSLYLLEPEEKDQPLRVVPKS
ncbi:MAG: hypothetical protein WED00_15915 [Aquisalimonadaceae bacterium]